MSISGGRFKWAGGLDMYRKVPVDLMEGTRRGSLLSYVAVISMALLFLLETRAFFRIKTVTDLALDTNDEKRVRVNFNITMMDLKCEYAVVDVVSVLGTEQNVSAHVSKWHVDAAGIRRRYQGRNRAQKDIELFDTSVTHTLDQLYEDGEDAVSLDPETFQYALKEQEYLFVDYYAPWCSHCRDLAPTWETLGEVMTVVAEDIVDARNHSYSDEDFEHAKRVELPVMIAKVDCVVHAAFCRQEGIMAYPTLRLFVDGERWRGGDYRGHRTVLEMADYLRQVEDTHKSELDKDAPKNAELAHRAAKERTGLLDEGSEDDEMSAEENEWADKIKRRKQRLHHSWVDAEHPGCQLSGHLLLDRVPGNFHIQARSPHHDLVPHMTNVSHFVHHLSVGEPVARRMIDKGQVYVPDGVKGKVSPMDGNVYVSDELHEAYHHYLKVITTNVDGLSMGRRTLKAYQVISSSHLSYYRNDVIPEAKFILDLSPIAVTYRKTSRHWYDYLTSVMAIVGGTFTLVGMMESTISVAVARKKNY